MRNFNKGLLLIIIGIIIFALSSTIMVDKINELSNQEEYYRIKVIDNCEYVVYRYYDRGGITHKGNCKNH